MATFQVGDIVKFKVGNGPEMIVFQVNGDVSVHVVFYNNVSGTFEERQHFSYMVTKTGNVRDESTDQGKKAASKKRRSDRKKA